MWSILLPAMVSNTFPLEAMSLSLTRGGRQVLNEVSLRARGGRVTSVVGPSGAGKTSLLRCLNRLEEPQSGRVLLEGADIRSLPPTTLRQRIGMIFQTPVILEGGVRANLAYGLRSVTSEDMENALEHSGLPSSFLQRDSAALSVGQAQRVCIARALVRSPGVLLMDEPTSALDRDAAGKIERLITRLADEGLTIIVVTHDLGQAERLASDALLLVEGRVVAAGSIEEVAGAWPKEQTT